MGRHLTPRPSATVVLLLITAAGTFLALRSPAFLAVVERTPDLISRHQWWRLVTPVLANPEGWGQILTNFLGLAFLGLLAESFWGSGLLLGLYLCGAISGQLAGLAWRPEGAGSSVAICALLGAVAIGLWQRIGSPPARAGAVFILAGALILTGFRDLHGPPILVGAALAMVFAALHPARALDYD
jgi:rhomboid protease GluP